MKRKIYLLSIAILLAGLLPMLLMLDSCNPPEPKICNFEGVVLDQDSVAVADASVELDGETTTTDDDGRFCINAEIQKEDSRYVLNIEKLGFGLVSKIYTEPTKEISITMTTATVVEDLASEADEEGVVVIEDTTPPPPESEPLSADIPTINFPLDTVPFVYGGAGKLVGFGSYLDLGETYDAIEQFGPVSQGASVELDVDDLEAAGTTTASILTMQGNEKRSITGSIGTMDIYNPDGMPGDYTYRSLEGERGFMRTFGAADINFYQEGKPMQLKKGKYARLRIPVDQVAANGLGKDVPETIPLLIYDKKTGEWKDDKDKWTGEINRGRLTKIKDPERGEILVYEAKISHFSVYNMDEEFTTPSCTRILNPNTSAFAPGATIEVAVPGHVNNFPIGTGCPDLCGATGNSVHAISRMLENQAIGLRVFDSSGNLKSTNVLVGGASSPDVFYTACADSPNPFCDCLSEVVLEYEPCWLEQSVVPNEMKGPVLAVNRDGTTDNFRFSWVYIDPAATITPGPPAVVTNPSTSYKVEYFTAINQSVNLDMSESSWTDIPGTIVTDTDWMHDFSVTLVGISTADPVFFRVTYSTDGGVTFKGSTIYLLNEATLMAGQPLWLDYTSFSCSNVGVAVI